MDKLPIKMSPGQALSMLDRAVKEHFAARCKLSDLESIALYFRRHGRLRCIYCGKEPNRWDHFHPVSRGGDTVPGNLVPACGSCDDSKGKKTLIEWADGRGKHKPDKAKLARIQQEVADYQTHFRHKPREFDVKLTPDEMARYMRFLDEIARLRAHFSTEGILRGEI